MNAELRKCSSGKWDETHNEINVTIISKVSGKQRAKKKKMKMSTEQNEREREKERETLVCTI